jgi:hypothetical protein
MLPIVLYDAELVYPKVGFSKVPHNVERVANRFW